MKPIKTFKEYIGEGVVRKASPDINRAKFLKNESDRRSAFLKDMANKLGVSDINANYFIENAYNLLSELLRAKMLMEGYSASGLGSHEAEVSYMEDLSFSNNEIDFMNGLRYFRNGIQYYGKVYDKEYAIKVLKFTKEIAFKLNKMIKL